MPPDAGPPANTSPLRPALGLLDTTFLVMGSIVGAGIFITPHFVAAAVPSLAGILVTWVAGGAIALSGAFVFAELGARFPRTGGQYVYLREAYGDWIASLYGWNLLAMVASGALAVVLGVCLDNLDLILRSLAGSTEPVLSVHQSAAIGLATIAVLAAINIRGVRLGASVHNVLMALKVVSILLVIALGAVAAWGGGPPALRDDAGGAIGQLERAALGTALLAALFSYGGWQNVASVSGEVRDAKRTLPRAVVLGTASVIALYLGLNLSLVQILGVAGVASTVTPVASAAGSVLGRWGQDLVAGMVVLSTLGIAHTLLLLPPRVCFAMARDGLFFSICGAAHPGRGTPHIAILAQAGFAALHWLVALYIYDIGTALDAAVFIDWIGFALAAGAYFIFRRRAPGATTEYRAPAHPWVALVFLAASCLVVAGTIVAEAVKLWRGEPAHRLVIPLSVLAVGAVLPFVWRRGRAGA